MKPGDTPPLSSRSGELTEPSDRRRGAFEEDALRIRGWVVLALVCLATIAGTTRPAWRAVKRLRAEVYARQAEGFVAREEWALAFSASRSALQLDAAAPRALRTAAALHARLGNEVAFRYFDTLLASASATVVDRENCLELAVRHGATNLALVHAEILLSSPQPSPRALRLGAQLHHQLGDRGRALQLAEASVRSSPTDPTNAFALASIRADSQRVSDRAAAREVLWPFARQPGAFRLEALSRILTTPDATRAEREEVRGILAAIPQPKLEERLLLVEAEVNLDPSSSSAAADRVLADIQPATARERRLVAEWLQSRGFPAKALELLNDERIFTDRDLYLLRHRILMGLGQMRRGYDLLFHPASPLPAFDLEVLRCIAAARMGEQGLRDKHLALAAAGVGTEMRRAAILTQLALWCGRPDPAVETWRGILKSGRARRSALRQLGMLEERRGDTAEALNLARQLASVEPAARPDRLRTLRLQLLLGQDLDEAAQEIRALVAADPVDRQARVLLGLYHLRRQEPELAEIAVQGTAVGTDPVFPWMHAVCAAVLHARGHWKEARSEMDWISIGSLLPEERALLGPIAALDSRLVTEPPAE